MKSIVHQQEVEDRWVAIRRRINNAVYKEDVAEFLSRSESDLTKKKIIATLSELANYRLDSPDGWVNEGETSAQGDVVICEGLETFFVPAVEGTLSIQEFMETYADRSQEFLRFIQDDLGNLLERWLKKGFEGTPYIKGRSNRVLKPEYQEKGINLVESACMSIRIIIHFYTLVLQSNGKEKRFSEFFESFLRTQKNKFQQVFSNALSLIVESFQKGKDGKIETAETEGMPGSGWSWCQFEGLPPMLYFTQCAVDAFTELDVYLIRPHQKKDNMTVAMEKLFSENQQAINDFQFCVDMSRRWVLNRVLNKISHNYGLHFEEYANVKILDTIDDEFKMSQYIAELESIDNFEREKNNDSVLSPFITRRGNREKELNAPFVEYNSLYSLLIILWTFGDQREDGEEADSTIKAKIERALLQLVINYRKYPTIREIVDKYPYRFTLPDVQKGEKIFSSNSSPDHQLAYEDSGFLTLLARLLVFFGVYGIADHSLLDPIIKELYTDLLFSRNRRNAKYPNLWSQNDIEVFSTFRAVQTLTFYYIYQQGKELNQGESKKQTPSQLFQAVADQLAKSEMQSDSVPKTSNTDQSIPKKEFPFPNFREYYRKNSSQDWSPAVDQLQKDHIKRFETLGDMIIHALKCNKMKEERGCNVLESLVSYLEKPWDKNGKLLHRNKIEGLEEHLGLDENI